MYLKRLFLSSILAVLLALIFSTTLTKPAFADTDFTPFVVSYEVFPIGPHQSAIIP